MSLFDRFSWSNRRQLPSRRRPLRQTRHEALEPRQMLTASGFAGNDCAPDLDLDSIGPQTVRVGETLTLNLPALGGLLTDLDAAGTATGDNLRWLMDPDTGSDFPTGATLSSAGVFSWSPSEAQIGQHDVFVIGIDSGSPALADSEKLIITVGAASNNIAPGLRLSGFGGDDYSGSFTEDGGPVPIVDSVFLQVFDPDSANLGPITATLTNRPDGSAELLDANIEAFSGLTKSYDPTTGVLTVSGARSSGTYQAVLRSLTYNNTSQDPDTADRIITIKISDGEADSPTRTSTITVIAENDAPTLSPIADRNVLVDNELVVPVAATDVDTGDTLTLALDVNNSPAGAVLTDNGDGTGEIRWTPDTISFPGDVGFRVLVDDGVSPTPGEASFAVTVHPVNIAPDLAPIADRTIEVGQPMTVVVSATDQNPSQTLTYFLDPSSAPQGATIVPNTDGTATITWTPTAGDAPGTVEFEVLVTDNGFAPLVDGETFDVTVQTAV